MKMKCKYLDMRLRLMVAVIAVAGAAFCALAAPVDSARAEREAGEFLMSRVGAFGTRSTVPAMKTVYASQAANGANTFFVVNNEEAGCYAIVSADDRLPRVLGWSDKGCFDPDDIPENVRWWLGQYDVEISALLKADPSEEATRGIYEPRYRDAIEPMLKSTWNQSAPYNNMCPTVKGSKSVTGCVATAMAQVMRYHQWPKYPTGANKDYTFSGTELDWSLMLDTYNPGAYTTRQANAVALLMLQCGRSVNMSYSPQESGAQGNMVPYALTTYFDYSQDVRLEYRDYFSASAWEDMVYGELEAERPVLYSGFSYAGGHAFVCDGYLEGYYHFNWGWGGYQDGYFLLNALNPAAGGIGSYVGGYNLNQLILTGVKKNNGSTDRQYMMVTNGGFVCNPESGYFSIVPDSGDQGIMYNPLSYAMTLSVGIRLEGPDGKTAGYGSVRGSEEVLPGWGYDRYTPDFPELPAGTYRVYPAFRDQKGDWHDVRVVYGDQQYCKATYDGSGDITLSNPGAPASMKPGFVFSDPIVSAEASPGSPVSVSYYVTNIGPGDYTGYVIGALSAAGVEPSEDNMDLGVLSLPVGSTELLTFMMQAPDKEKVEMNVFDMEMNPMSAAETLTLSGKLTDKRSASRKLDVRMLSPFSATVATEPGISIYVENLTEEKVPVQFCFEIYDQWGEKVRSFSSGELTLPANYANAINFGSVSLGIDPGWYFWRVSEMNGEAVGNTLSLSYPLQVTSGVKTYEFTDFFTITGESTAEYSRPPIGTYSDDIDIAEVLEGERITAIEGNAFVNSPKLRSLGIPASVSRLGSGLLYMTPQLRDLTVASATPFGISDNLMEASAFARVRLHTPAGSENAYMHSDVWSRFSMPRWFMDIPSGVTVKGLQVDPGTGEVYTPYYVNGIDELTFDIELPEGFSAIVGWVIPETGKEHYACQNAGKVTLPALDALNGSMYIRLVDSASVADANDGEGLADVYTTTGVCVLRQASAAEIASLPEGIYIVNGKKIVIR